LPNRAKTFKDGIQIGLSHSLCQHRGMRVFLLTLSSLRWFTCRKSYSKHQTPRFTWTSTA